jgi:hypothetical protein
MKINGSFEEFKKKVEEVKESQKDLLYRKGITIDGKHYSLFIFLTGPIYLSQKPEDCKLSTLTFPGSYFTVHMSYGHDKEPVINKTKYYCRTYRSAKELAEKIKGDKGIEIIETINKPKEDSDSDCEDNDYYSFRSTKKYGGYNGFDERTIDDAFEGDPELTWNVD